MESQWPHALGCNTETGGRLSDSAAVSVEEASEDEIGEVVILKVEPTESEDEESYVGVEDEEILNKVFEIFKEKFKDEFNYVDGEE